MRVDLGSSQSEFRRMIVLKPIPRVVAFNEEVIGACLRFEAASDVRTRVALLQVLEAKLTIATSRSKASAPRPW